MIKFREFDFGPPAFGRLVGEFRRRLCTPHPFVSGVQGLVATHLDDDGWDMATLFHCSQAAANAALELSA